MRLKNRNRVVAAALGTLVAGWLSAGPLAAQENPGGTGSPAEAGGAETRAAGTSAPPAGGTAAAAGTSAPATGAPAGGGPSSSGLAGESGGYPGTPTLFAPGTAAPADHLAGLLAAAMARNPDIVVAEAKVRAAQSELDRSRLEVSRQVVDTFQAVRFARKSIEVAKAQVATSKEQQAHIRQLYGEVAIPDAQVTAADAAVREAELALIKAEASLEATLATLDYLTGGQAMPGGPMGMGMPGMGGVGAAFGSDGDVLGAGAGAGGGDPNDDSQPANAERVAGDGKSAWKAFPFSAADTGNAFPSRLRRKLAEPTSLDLVDAALGEAMQYLDDVHGITNIVIDKGGLSNGRELKDEPITLKLENVPLSAALKAIEDVANVRFSVTDYGLRVTPRDFVVEDATPLRQFLKTVTGTGAFGYGGGSFGDAAGGNPFGSAGGGDGTTEAPKPADALKSSGGAAPGLDAGRGDPKMP